MITSIIAHQEDYMQQSPTSFSMEPRFAPQELEKQLYQAWEESGLFAPKAVDTAKAFTIVMPPPNITGQLHMGHAMDCVLQDVPVRYHRMKGDATLWVPGTDHASIATEVKIVEQMAKEGLTKESLGREGFLALEGGVRRTDHPATPADGRILRLEQGAVHHG